MSEADAAPFRAPASAVSWGAKMIRGIVARDLESDDAEAVAELARRESRWLLEAAAVSAGRDPLFVRQPDLSPRVVAVFRSHIARRGRGEPLGYVLGEASFRGIDLIVTPDVLIPRPETEQLIDLALELIPRDRELDVIDQGTGSGAVAIALAIERPRIRVTGIDISEPAVNVARRNVARHGLTRQVSIVQGDLFPGEEPYSAFDLLIANLPYLAEDAVLPPVVAEWEPKSALRAGRSGMELIERSIQSSRDWIREGGILLYEIGDHQSGFPDCFSRRRDLTGRIRFIMGRHSGGRIHALAQGDPGFPDRDGNSRSESDLLENRVRASAPAS